MIKIKETATKFRLLQCIRLIGDLSIQISGESKVMFKVNSTDRYFTHGVITLPGDQGCIEPLDNGPCALDELVKFFSDLIPWMYQNDEEFESIITDEFKQWVSVDVGKMIYDHFTNEGTETVSCEFIPHGEIDPITVISVGASVNVFVRDMYEEIEDAEYAGEILKKEKLEEENKYNLSVKLKRRESSITIDLSGKFMMLGITDINKARYLYWINDDTPVLSPVKLHGSERGSIIINTHRAEQ